MMIVANSPAGQVLGHFRPLAKFPYVETDEEGVPVLKAMYLPKFTYTIRTPELNDKVDEWVSEGKVRRVEA